MSAPFTAVGLTLLLISASVAVNLREAAHRANELHLQTQELLRLSAKVHAAEVDLSNLLRNAVYLAAREVGAEADNYPSDELRKSALERLALQHLQSLAPWLPLLEGVRVLCEPTSLQIEPAENGFIRARCEMNALLYASGAQVKLTRPLREVQAFVDCRYFLLQERMNEFLRRLDEIHDRWRKMEYLRAWGGALGGRVKLSREETAALFEMAWCRQELEVFGSFFPPSASIQLASLTPPTLQPAVEAAEEALLEAGKEAPAKERARAVRSRLQKLESVLSGLGENLLPQLKDALSTLEKKLEVENLPENEADRVMRELLQEGVEEEVESWRLGESGLEKTKIRAPKLQELTLPSLLRFLKGAQEELFLLNPFPEILPPHPMGPQGLSVIREMRISEVSFSREDPCGNLGRAAATPIYLWFLGVTAWWGQYTITLELEDRPTEKILDYENPTLPLNFPLPAHYPLSYTYRIPRQRFRTRVIVVLPRPFILES